VDRNQYDVFLEVLRRLDNAGVLSKIVLIINFRRHFLG